MNEPRIRTDNMSFAFHLTNELIIKKKAIKQLEGVGIEIKYFKLPIGYMHNKFAIIDNKLLINGSFNWTKGGLKDNYEDVVITSDSQLVELYSKKFNDFWNLLETNVGREYYYEI